MLLLIKFLDNIVQNSPTDVVKAVYDVCFDAVIRIVLQSDDHSEMQVIFYDRLHFYHFSKCLFKNDLCGDVFDQNATECLAALISGGRQDMLSWGDSGFIMRSLLDVASR